MTQKGVSSKKLPVEPKGSRLIAQDPDDPFLTLPRELPSTPPSSSVSTSFALSWPGWITAMSVGSTSTPQQTDRSSESSWQSRSPKDCDEMATDIDVSSISSSDTFSGHSSPALAPAKTQRRQAIPISFLVHPTHVAPRISTSLSFFHPSPEASNAFSRQDNWPLFLPESKPTSDPRPSMPSPPSIRSVMAVPYMDSEGFLPDGDIPNSIAKSHDELPTVLHDLPDHAPTIGNHHLKRVPLRIYDGEHLETFKDSTDRPSVNTTTGSTNEDDEIIDHQASTKRIVSPNVKTTKTGKILHRSKKVGGSKKLTAYDRFLQQRSKYLAEHRSELTPQQRMKIIAEEWAVSDKNQHTTRRRSRFLGPDGKLHLPLTSPLTAIASGDDPANLGDLSDARRPSQDDSSIASQSPSRGDTMADCVYPDNNVQDTANLL